MRYLLCTRSDRIAPWLLLLFSVLAPAALAQETIRQLDRPGQHTKHLTRDTVDRWEFALRKGEVLRVFASSGEFDPVLELIENAPEMAQLVEPVDGIGSQSRFVYRVRDDQDGLKVAILVHGPSNRGGGNYRLEVERMRPLRVDSTGKGTSALDRTGSAIVSFHAGQGTYVFPHVHRGGQVAEVMDPSGAPIDGWVGCYRIPATGECFARIRGRQAQRFAFQLTEARRRETPATWMSGKGFRAEDSIEGASLDIWTLKGNAGDTLAIELTSPRALQVRLLPVGGVNKTDGRTGNRAQLDGKDPLVAIPVHSKGDHQRFVWVITKGGPFQIQLACQPGAATPYELKVFDPVQTVAIGETRKDTIEIGGSRLFALQAEAGQFLQLDAASGSFDPCISVLRADGSRFDFNDDGGAGANSKLGFLVRESGRYLVHVTCFGNGGGGAFSFAANKLAIPRMAIGSTVQGATRGAGISYWQIEGQTGQSILVLPRSMTADLAVRVYGPNGVELGYDDDSGIDKDPMLSLRLPADGRYTIAVETRSGQGDMTLKLLNMDS